MAWTPEQRRAYQREYYQRNREQIREKERIRYANRDRDEKRKRSREYYRQNRTKVLERTALYRKQNPDQVRERQRAWRVRNQDVILEQGRQINLRRRHGLWPEEWAAMWAEQEGRCYLCGDELVSETTHVDHDHSHCGPMNSCRVCQRGLAHADCNHAIGNAGDDPARLRRMADALEIAQVAFRQRRAAGAGEQLTLA